MAKWLKEGRNAGGFAIKKKIKGERRREGKKGKGNTVEATRTHLLNFLILRKRQHWEQTFHWLDLKGERKEGTKKKSGKENRDVTLFQGNMAHPFVWIKECPPNHLYLTMIEETQS